MMRLAPPGHERFSQAAAFEVCFGGGEANVAVSLANFGEEAEFVTRLPKNDLGEACLAFLRQHGVGTRYVLRGGERLGIYFYENGAAQRGSRVIYDRAGSSFATIRPGMVDWITVFKDAQWFHWSGITPAVSQGAADACLEAVQAARQAGLTVSGDLNFRAKLWQWGKAAGEVMTPLVALSDVVIGNEEDAEKVFGICAPGVDVTAGNLDAQAYHPVIEQIQARFPNLKTIAVTLRGSISASHNRWSAILWQGGSFFNGPVYDILPVVDRVGGGDAFAAGLIYAVNKHPDDPASALRFALAASCLKHSIPGDFNLVSLAEVEQLAGGNASGRVVR
jgi:2-dehydro-3-deoxygluconokinase